MKSKTTILWFVIAAALAAFIFISQHFNNSATVATPQILAHLQPQNVTSIQIIPAGAPEICANRTNGDWFLTQPISYPAQPAAIEALLDSLQKLQPATRIAPAELRGHADANAEFGFDNPQFTIVVESGEQSQRLLVGKKTAPGDQVFLRVVGAEGAFVADADWLNLIPHSSNDWRDTALVDVNQVANCDWIILTNGAKGLSMEFRRDPTNHLWQMIRPLPARADGSRITDALQKLQTAAVSQFVTDDPKADLNAFGLQPANLDLWFGRGTNFSAAIHLGKNSTNDTSQIFAKRQNWNAVVTTAGEPFSPWRGTVNDFRDPHLFELTAPVAEIESRGETNFTLQLQGTNGWKIAGENFPVDAGSVQQFIEMLAKLRVVDFVKDVVTASDLKTYGLVSPPRQIILRSAIGDTNAIIAQLLFGERQTNEVFVRRADEDFVYAVSREDFNRLPDESWEFRERRIWNFSENDVAQITIRQDGKTRQITHTGPNKWSLAAGSQGIIISAAIEDLAHRFGELTAVGWIGRNVTNTAQYATLNGFKPDNRQIVIELKDGRKFTLDFIADLPQGQTVLAAVTLDSERWAFVLSPALYQLVLSYLAIPANVP